MFAGTTFEEARATRKHYVLPNGTGFFKSEYIISDSADAPAGEKPNLEPISKQIQNQIPNQIPRRMHLRC